MATPTKTGNCTRCTREDVTLYRQPEGWVCGKCLRKLQAKDRKYDK
jgi:hypothetical protein